MKKIIPSIVLIIISVNIRAQESCTEKLFKASNLYEKGQMKEAIEIAKSCANESNTTSEKWQAYRLLAMAYLVNNQTGEARKAAEKMLELNPTYKPSILKDPTELTRLLKSIRVIPKFSIGVALTVGGNFTYSNITETYNGADYTKNYTSQTSWQTGVLPGYQLNPIISVFSGLIATSKNYSINYSTSGWNINVNEHLSYLDVPLFARFAFLPDHALRFFIDAGGFVGYMLTSQSDFSNNNPSVANTISTNNLNSEQRRNNYEYGVTTGIGAMYKMGSVNVTIDVKYYLSYANITNEANRYNNPNLFYNYYFIEDNIRLNNLAISLSLNYNLNYRVIKNK